MSLGTMPLEEVETSFYNLRAETSPQIKQQLRQLFLYFDTYWINEVPLKLWNVYGYENRTNNTCEGIFVFSFSPVN